MTGVRVNPAAVPAGAAVDGFVEQPARERTPWLLAFLCLLIPILPSNSVPLGPLKSNGSPARVITMALLLLVVLGFLLIRRSVSTQTMRPGVIILLVYYFTSLLIYGWGLTEQGYSTVEASKTRAIIAVTTNVGLALYVLTRVQTARQISVLLGCLAVGITFNCVAGLLQAFTDVNLHVFFQPPGFALNVTDEGGGVAGALDERFGAKRVLGTAKHPIEFSVLAAIALPLTIHFARYATSRQTRVLAALAACIALFAMPAAISRTGVIVLVAALLVYIWGTKLRALAAAVTVGLAAFLVELAVAPHIAEALWKTIINSEEDDSVLARIADYAKVAQTFHERPFFGVGLGAAPPSQFGFLDNDWLQAIVQGGIVGLAAMAVLHVGGVFGIAAALRCAQNERERDQAYAMGAMLVGAISSSFTFDLTSYQQITLPYFILFALLWCRFTVSYSTALKGPNAPAARKASHHER